MLRRILLLSLALLYPTVARSATASNSVITRPCTIIVDNHKNNGERATSYFTTKLRSRMECLTLAQIHYPNYDTDTVKSKNVVYKWNFVPKPPKRTVHRQFKARHKKLVAAYRRR